MKKIAFIFLLGISLTSCEKNKIPVNTEYLQTKYPDCKIHLLSDHHYIVVDTNCNILHVIMDLNYKKPKVHSTIKL